MQKVIYHKELGRVVLIKTIRNRSIRITVNRKEGIKISMPFFSAYSQALDFLETKLSTIKDIMQRQANTQLPMRVYGEGHDIKILTGIVKFVRNAKVHSHVPYKKETAIKIHYNNKCKPDNSPSNLYGNEFIVLYPASWGREITRDSKEWIAIHDAYQKILRREAKHILPYKLANIAIDISNKCNSEVAFNYNNISIKNNKTNWGSCSYKNNINLNMHLLEIEEELIDFVIKHELCHLVHHNHGTQFHDLLNSLCNGKEKYYSKLLKMQKILN